MKGRHHHQAAEERGPQELQQLSKDHAAVSGRQGSQQSSSGEDERGSQPQPAGWLPQEHILCGPDCQPAPDHFHKWRPLLHFFVFMLITPTALILKQIFF